MGHIACDFVQQWAIILNRATPNKLHTSPVPTSTFCSNFGSNWNMNEMNQQTEKLVQTHPPPLSQNSGYGPAFCRGLWSLVFSISYSSPLDMEGGFGLAIFGLAAFGLTIFELAACTHPWWCYVSLVGSQHTNRSINLNISVGRGGWGRPLPPNFLVSIFFHCCTYQIQQIRLTFYYVWSFW